MMIDTLNKSLLYGLSISSKVATYAL